MSKSELRYYACGETDHDLHQLFAGHQHETRTFPAGVFLFTHESGERVLFDTGYGPVIEGGGLKGAVYKRVLPPRVSKNYVIESQLRDDGIDPDSIGHVVLSHLHPDHIGGVQYFPAAKFIMAKSAADNLRKPRLLDGVIPGLLPAWFRDADKALLGTNELNAKLSGPSPGFDLFDDGSFVITELPGHARGHLGAMVMSRIMLAADASWGRDLLGSACDLRLLPRLINDDIAAYQTTAIRLMELEAEGVEVCLSHDMYDQKILLS